MNALAERSKQVFLDIIRQPGSAPWDHRVQLACGDDRALRERVEALLRAHGGADSFLHAAPSPVSVASTDATEIFLPLVEQPGQCIGPFKLLQQIGEGGFGVVYMAEQQEPVRRKVALKIIKPGMDTKEVIARFESERQALALMDHPNIARVLDAGATDSGRPYFVMELVKGVPLTEFCDSNHLAPRQRLELFINVCHAVQHAHQKGIIHRDLKPSNVMVTLHDGVPVPKVIDFGVSKAVSQQLTEKTFFTAYGQMVGTPLYMSPEQAELSALDVDTRSDVYSLGVLLYELLTGTTPFDKERLKSTSFDEMRRIIREEEPETISARLARTRRDERGARNRERGINDEHLAPRSALRVPRFSELDWIVMKALEKDRNQRYESASALGADVQRYLNDEQVLACPPSFAYRFRKFARKNKAAFTTAALIAVSLGVGSGISLWQAIRATAARAEASANEAKAKSEEQKATAFAQSEAVQRKYAERNFEAALDAVDRMLTHLNSEDLNEVPSIGPLRRRILKDAIVFYQGIPLQSGSSVQTRYRMAHTWHRIGEIAREMNARDDAMMAYQGAIELLTQLVAEEPTTRNHLARLGRAYHDVGWFYLYETRELPAAEQSFRKAGEIFAQVPNSSKTMQASVLSGRGVALGTLGIRSEAMNSFFAALDLLDRSLGDQQLQYAVTLHHMANVSSAYDQLQSADLYRQAIVEFRESQTKTNLTDHQCGVFASLLDDAAKAIASLYPKEAERLWAESIEVRKAAYASSPRDRTHLFMLIRALRNYALHLRPGTGDCPDEDPTRAASRIAKSDELFREAIARQRELVSRFALAEDRYDLIQLLEAQSRYSVGLADSAGAWARHDGVNRLLETDDLLTEAIQLCRALAAEFPDNSDYKSRLDALLKLQAEHFGKQDGDPVNATEQPK